MRRRGLFTAAVVTLALAVSACTTGQTVDTDAAVQPAEAPANGAETPSAPNGLATNLPRSSPPDAVSDFDRGGVATYERTWNDPAWPSVAVPPSPAPRLATSCAQVLDASGLAPSVRQLTVQPTVDTLALRQGGVTVCSFASGSASTLAVFTLQIVVDVAVGRDIDTSCSFADNEGPISCRGSVDAGTGSARIVVDLPSSADYETGREAAQQLLVAAADALANPGTVRPLPAVNGSAMGSGSGGCAPSTAQQDAVFSQVDIVSGNRDVYGGSSIGNDLLSRELHARIGTTLCWWWLGWAGIQIAVVPGTGWSLTEPGVVGTPITVDGANSALRVERSVMSGVSYNGEPPAELLEITLITSARGSTVITTAAIDPSQQSYWRERLVGATEAIIATQP